MSELEFFFVLLGFRMVWTRFECHARIHHEESGHQYFAEIVPLSDFL